MRTETMLCNNCKSTFISNEWCFYGDAGHCPECGGWLRVSYV